jgi:hypothetical protein
MQNVLAKERVKFSFKDGTKCMGYEDNYEKKKHLNYQPVDLIRLLWTSTRS